MKVEYDTNTLKIEMWGLTLWFSYQTVIAFQERGKAMRVCENAWSNTTGKHISAIDGGNKKARIPRDAFMQELNAIMTRKELD